MPKINAELNVKATPDTYNQLAFTNNASNLSYNNTSVATQLSNTTGFKGTATKNGNVIDIIINNLSQTIYRVSFITPSDYQDTDTYRINGIPITITDINNEPLNEAWNIGAMVSLNINKNKGYY